MMMDFLEDTLLRICLRLVGFEIEIVFLNIENVLDINCITMVFSISWTCFLEKKIFFSLKLIDWLREDHVRILSY